MNFIARFFHEIVNPHCPECEARPKCESCETLRQELARSNYEKEQMLRYILEPQPTLNRVESTVDDAPEPIRPKIVPWNIRRQMLEEEDRQKAILAQQQKKEQATAIKELEKNMGIISETVLDLGDEDVQSKSV